MRTIKIFVNGKNRSVLSDSDTPLIYVLRNELGLTGTKLGCGLEQCGACMVLVDGEATYSCTRAVKEHGERPHCLSWSLHLGSEVGGVAALKRGRYVGTPTHAHVSHRCEIQVAQSRVTRSQL